LPTSQKIEINPIGLVKRSSPDEKEKNRSLVSKIVVENEFAKDLNGIEE